MVTTFRILKGKAAITGYSTVGMSQDILGWTIILRFNELMTTPAQNISPSKELQGLELDDISKFIDELTSLVVLHMTTPTDKVQHIFPYF